MSYRDYSPPARRRSPSPPPVSRYDSRSPPRRRSPSPRGYNRGSPPRGRSPYYGRSYSPRRGFGGGRGGRGGPYSRPPLRRRSPFKDPVALKESTTLFVGNLPYSFREADCLDVFERYGRVKNVSVGFNHRTNQSKGYAFVEFEERRSAEEAYEELKTRELQGRRLRVDWDVGRDKKPSAPAIGRGRSPSPRGGGGGGGRGRYSSRSPSPRRGSPSPSPRKRSPSPYGERPLPPNSGFDDGRRPF